MDMQPGHAAWTCSSDMGIRKDKQHGIKSWKNYVENLYNSSRAKKVKVKAHFYKNLKLLHSA
jgi:hypothetical protein